MAMHRKTNAYRGRTLLMAKRAPPVTNTSGRAAKATLLLGRRRKVFEQFGHSFNIETAKKQAE